MKGKKTKALVIELFDNDIDLFKKAINTIASEVGKPGFNKILPTDQLELFLKFQSVVNENS